LFNPALNFKEIARPTVIQNAAFWAAIETIKPL